SDSSYLSLALYVFAMSLHAFILDHELVKQFEGFYEPWAGLLLAAIVIGGWLLAAVNLVPAIAAFGMVAFVVGALACTCALEETPAQEGMRFWWFVAGASFYAAVLVLV